MRVTVKRDEHARVVYNVEMVYPLDELRLRRSSRTMPKESKSKRRPNHDERQRDQWDPD